MDTETVPRRRNLRPRKRWDYVEEAPPPRAPHRARRARPRIVAEEVADVQGDDEWDASADDEQEARLVSRSRAEFRRRHRELRMRSRAASAPRESPKKIPKLRIRRPKKLLPEDVYGRELQPQPAPAGHGPAHDAHIVFIAVFLSTFAELFVDFPQALAPQDLEEGLIADPPGPLVEMLFRRLLGLVLNRKKEIEVGRYASALSEAHALRRALGVGALFPPLNWKSKGNAFAELSWPDRARLLHALATWALAASEQVRAVLKTLDDDSVHPWIAGDEDGRHYYFLGFYPFADSEERTRFRLYRQTSRLLATVCWEPLASSTDEVIAFLKSHEIPTKTEKPQIVDDEDDEPDASAADKQESNATTVEEKPDGASAASGLRDDADDADDADNAHTDADAEENASAVAAGTGGSASGDAKAADSELETGEKLAEVGPGVAKETPEATGDAVEADAGSNAAESVAASAGPEAGVDRSNLVPPTAAGGLIDEGAASAAPAEPSPPPLETLVNTDVKAYNLPKPVVALLLELLPLMQQSEMLASQRLELREREEKRIARRAELQRQSESLRAESRHAGRTRRKRVDYSSFLRDVSGDAPSDGDYDDTEPAHKRRLRARGSDYAWGVPEPESRQQRHARLLTERADRDF